jgi:hypothetical protein
LTPSTSILSAQAHTDFQNGTNDETSAGFLSRSVSYLSSLASTLVKASQVDAFVSNGYSGLVSRVRTYDLTDGTDTGIIATSKTKAITNVTITSSIATITIGSNHQFEVGDIVTVSGLTNTVCNGTYTLTAVGGATISYPRTGSISNPVDSGTVAKGVDVVGYITVFVYGNGNFLTETQLDDIQYEVANKAIPGLVVNVRNVELLSLGVTASVVLDSNYDQEPLQQTVENSLIEYLSPNSYPTSEDAVRVNQLIAIISSIPGVRYVSSLSLSPGTGNWLPQIDTNLEPANKGWAPRITPDDLTISYTVV